MAEYIDRGKLLQHICNGTCGIGYEGACPNCDTVGMIEEFPSADVAPVVHGRWVYKHRHRGGVNIYEGVDEFGEKRRISVDERYETDDPYCPACGKLNDGSALNYCPNCGAKMDGGDGNV